jgi:hypothetical protein
LLAALKAEAKLINALESLRVFDGNDEVTAQLVVSRVEWQVEAVEAATTSDATLYNNNDKNGTTELRCFCNKKNCVCTTIRTMCGREAGL